MKLKTIILSLSILVIALVVFVAIDRIPEANENVYSNSDSANRTEQEADEVVSQEVNQEITGNEPPAPSVSGFPKQGDIPLSMPIEEFAIKSSGEKLRIFDVFIQAGKFVPNKIVVNQGDRVQFNLRTDAETADIESQQLRLFAKVTKEKAEFVSMSLPDAGVFQFSCRDFCPGEKRFWGELIVLEKK